MRYHSHNWRDCWTLHSAAWWKHWLPKQSISRPQLMSCKLENWCLMKCQVPHRPGCMTDGNDSNIMVFALPDDVCKCQCMWLSLAIHHHHLLVVLDRPAKILHLWCSVKSSGDVLFSHLSKPLNMAKLNFSSSPLPLHLYSHSPTIPPLFSSHIHTISISFPECSSIFHPTFVVPLMPCFIFCQALVPDIHCTLSQLLNQTSFLWLLSLTFGF